MSLVSHIFGNDSAHVHKNRSRSVRPHVPEQRMRFSSVNFILNLKIQERQSPHYNRAENSSHCVRHSVREEDTDSCRRKLGAYFSEVKQLKEECDIGSTV